MKTLLAAGAPAEAGCKFGPQELSGRIPAESLDDTRFFTSGGGGPLTVMVRSEDRALLVVFRAIASRATAACTAEAVEDEEVYAEICNPHDVAVDYHLVMHLDGTS